MSQSRFRDLLSAGLETAGLSPDERVIDRLAAYFELLKRWNSRINLTGFSLSAPSAQAVDRLIVEPLRLAANIAGSVDIWVDLGSGGGSPAIPLYLYRPSTRLVLVESKHRKAAFLRHAVRELGLPGVEVEASRIESITSSHRLAAQVELVTVRAVDPSESVLAAVEVLLRERGKALFVGSRLEPNAIPSTVELVNIGDVATVLAKKAAENRCST